MTENILNKTIDNGVIDEIMIAPIGEFTGSKADGSPIKEIISEENLNALADKLNSGDDVLLDRDHKSTKNGNDKDSKAAGWLDKWFVKPLVGLFARCKLTKYGKELLENREYRYTSPVFSLNDIGSPTDIHSVALTNVPAFKGHINPIINSESTEILTDEKDILKMNETELREIIISIISELEEAKKAQEIKEEVVEEIVENEETISEEKTEEVVEETVETEKVEEPKEIIKEKEEDEVIKIESLNSAPSISLGNEPIWKKLTGKEFREWCENHPRGI